MGWFSALLGWSLAAMYCQKPKWRVVNGVMALMCGVLFILWIMTKKGG